MASDRVFPPSPRRLALARRSGLHAASPLLVGGVACAAALIVMVTTARTTIARLGDTIAAACRGDSTALDLAHALPAVLEIASPLLAAAAVAALLGQLAQTRALWLPRRRLEGAPAVDAGPAARVRRAGFELVATAIVAAVAVAWLWLVAPRLAALPVAPLAAAAVIASALATFVIAWLAIATLDALLRHAALARALRMTPHERREDERLAGGDPRLRQYRARLAREPRARDAITGATLLLLGDDVAVVIAWHPTRRPIPVRTATGRGARATQLLGLARRYQLPVQRDAALAAALVAHDGPVPEPHWPRLAEIIAAVERR
ncbi:MAG TPA: EscU/YscU/HrcU family type III secretion system export apparatus switch protein [Kofleriaceae bacterium]|nr:EscU/YscU/HrcU family type III secretion system export apparatus switch protein [Kofleriaceae bacterium]